jgi:uncharacterized protein YdiU (UPF0061 family)
MTDRIATEPSTADPVGWKWDDTYTQLPGDLFEPTPAAPVDSPRAVVLNHPLAAALGLDFHALTPEAAAAFFAGQTRAPGAPRPIAQAYAGHQYGHFTILGDGRALILGEHRTPDGSLVDIQLKGSGPTRYSRSGDGRAALGPMLREYLISEAMAALGIPTTRSLAVVVTGERVYRDTVQRGAILTRVAASHIRVGTFEYAARRSHDTLRALADYTIARHHPDLADAPVTTRYLDLLRQTGQRQAVLIARWQAVGFIHGVMNTDNVALSGETIDYGPCAFMNAYDPTTVYSSIDRYGRYAYQNQPGITQWNLTRLAETLLPLLDPDPTRAIAAATEIIESFADQFEDAWLTAMRRKLGLTTPDPADEALVRSLLDWMQSTRADFTNTFRDLSRPSLPPSDPYRTPEFQSWHAQWQARQGREPYSPADAQALMRSVNPAVIPRNHRVEAALAAASERDDLTLLNQLHSVLSRPYDDLPPTAEALQEPPADESGYHTFCGT